MTGFQTSKDSLIKMILTGGHCSFASQKVLESFSIIVNPLCLYSIDYTKPGGDTDIYDVIW